MRPFAESFQELRQQRGNPSLRQIAETSGVSASHLSRALRGVDSKSFGPRAIAAVGQALGLPSDYFPETRQDFVFGQIRKDPALRDRLYDELR